MSFVDVFLFSSAFSIPVEKKRRISHESPLIQSILCLFSIVPYVDCWCSCALHKKKKQFLYFIHWCWQVSSNKNTFIFRFVCIFSSKIYATGGNLNNDPTAKEIVKFPKWKHFQCKKITDKETGKRKVERWRERKKIVKMEIGALFPGYIYSCALSHHRFILFIVEQKYTHSGALVPSNYYFVLCIGSTFTRNIKRKRFLKMFYSPNRTNEINTQWNVNNFLMDPDFYAHCGEKKEIYHQLWKIILFRYSFRIF